MPKLKDSAPTGPDLLSYYEDNWQTDMGAIFVGEGAILRGKSVLKEFDPHSWMEYLVFAVTGKNPRKIARLLNGIWTICTSYPDPRLWNNRIAALAGTARSTGVLAISAGISVSEAQIYGSKPIQGATDLLYRVKEKIDQGYSLDYLVIKELKRYRAVYGYGRPLASGDERIEPLMQFAKTLNAHDGIYVNLAFEISRFFEKSRYKYQMNIAAVAGGLVADIGLTAKEFYHLTTLCFTAGMFPCYIDAVDHPEGALFPLSVPRIKHQRKQTNRTWQVNRNSGTQL